MSYTNSQTNSRKSILVTGGAGFIGSNLTKFLIDMGYYVIVVDNLISGSIHNLNDLDSNNFTFINMDITDPGQWMVNNNNLIYRELDSGNMKYIFHLASIASPIFYKRYPLETLECGSIGTHNLFNFVDKVNKNIPILITSTSEVYGDPLISPQSEDYYGNVNCYGQRSCYDESKRYMESLARTFTVKYGLDIKIARLFNTYGEKMMFDDGRIIPTVINQCLYNENITIFGTGQQTRSFCYISDTINGMWELIRSKLNEPINIGNPYTEYNMLDTANIIRNIIGSNNDIIFCGIDKDDPKLRNPDIKKAKELLNWEPVISFKSGLEKTINYFKKYV